MSDHTPAATAAAGHAPSSLNHRLRRMTGRDPHESGRVATPLELLFDLAFVAAFGIAGNQMAHLLAEGHIGPAIGGFAFGLFAITWAWVNFTWFASAFDTDDWFYRITTMVQMVGVVVLALGLSDVCHSLDEGHGLNNGVMVAGYVVMRVAMLTQWLRLAVQSPQYRKTALTYAQWIAIAQVGWVVLAVLHLDLLPTMAVAGVLYLVELGGPVLAERRAKAPWHPHHLAERYGLLVIISLGEGVLGTIAAVQPIIADQGWSDDAIVLVTAGVVLTFGMWWAYFAAPLPISCTTIREQLSRSATCTSLCSGRSRRWAQACTLPLTCWKARRTLASTKRSAPLPFRWRSSLWPTSSSTRSWCAG